MKEKLDATTGLDASVYASAYHSWASYYKVSEIGIERIIASIRCSVAHFQSIEDYVHFYQYALLYVGYTQLDTVPQDVLLGLAFDLGVAALVGETIFNFGDLV